MQKLKIFLNPIFKLLKLFSKTMAKINNTIILSLIYFVFFSIIAIPYRIIILLKKKKTIKNKSYFKDKKLHPLNIDEYYTQF